MRLCDNLKVEFLEEQEPHTKVVMMHSLVHKVNWCNLIRMENKGVPRDVML